MKHRSQKLEIGTKLDDTPIEQSLQETCVVPLWLWFVQSVLISVGCCHVVLCSLSQR